MSRSDRGDGHQLGVASAIPSSEGATINIKEIIIMITKTISMCQGKGSLSHNNREFTAKNIDPLRTANNIVFVQQDLGEAYHQLFDEAVERYNAHQKRKDRMIDDYFQHLFNREPSKSVITGANKQKSFYEELVQIGTKDDTGVGTPDAEIAVACLREYMEYFQARNPNFYVFNAVLHLDEATPHLHINYIPVGYYERGLDTRNAMAKALEEMGFGKGSNAINNWRLEQWEVLQDICFNHGIIISEPQKSRGYNYTVEEYGKHQDEIKALNAEKAQVEGELAEKQAKREALDQQIEQKTAQVKTILNYIPDYEKEFKIEDECDQLRRELIGLLDGKLSIMKHKDAIIAKVQRLCKLVKKVNDNAHKSGDTIYSLHEKLNATMKEYDDACQRWKRAAEERTALRRDNAELSAEVDDLTEFVSLLKRFEPQKYAEVKQAQEYVHSQREQEAQQQSAARKKESWGLE